MLLAALDCFLGCLFCIFPNPLGCCLGRFQDCLGFIGSFAVKALELVQLVKSLFTQRTRLVKFGTNLFGTRIQHC